MKVQMTLSISLSKDIELELDRPFETYTQEELMDLYDNQIGLNGPKVAKHMDNVCVFGISSKAIRKEYNIDDYSFNK